MEWADFGIFGSWTGIDLLDFNEFDDADYQIYIPAIIAVLSVISLIIFALGLVKNDIKLGLVPIVLGIIVVILGILEYLWIMEDADSPLLDINVGMGLYLALASGILTLIFGAPTLKSE